jgi:AsmA protein
MPRGAIRITLITLAALLVLVVAGGAIVLARFDPDTLKPRIVAAVKAATGRDLALNGPIRLKPSLWPMIEATDVTFANPPGFSRPQMASVAALDLQLDVLPLLHRRLVILRLVLVHPDILLETDAAGRGNWQFTPVPGAASEAPAPAPGAPTPTPAVPAAAPSPARTAIAVRYVRIEDASFGFRDDRTGHLATLAVQQLVARSNGPGTPMQLDLSARYGATPFSLTGEIGPFARLLQPNASSPWPVKLTLAAADASLSADGSFAHPLQGRGYQLTVAGTMPQLAALAPLLPGVVLPPVSDVHFSARVADSGGPVPAISALTLQTGTADLGALVAGLRLDKLDVSAPQGGQPAQLSAAGQLDGAALTVTATAGPAQAILSGKLVGPLEVDATAQLAAATLAVKGSIAHPDALADAAFAVTAAIPDLAALPPIGRRKLPALKNIAFQGSLADAGGGFAHGISLHAMKLTMAEGDLAGDLTVMLGGVPSVTATLHADRIDADALQAAMQPAAPAPPANASSANPPAPAKPAGDGRIFSQTPLPFHWLHAGNGDVAVTVGDLRTGGADYRLINLHAVLRDGKLQLDPADANLPEGPFTAKLTADANPSSPPVTLSVHAPGLEVAPLFAAAGLPGYANGRLEVYADLHADGDSPHALAASVDGTLGLAMQGGTIDTRLLNNLLGPVFDRAGLITLLAHGGSSALRCFALRADASHGVADVRTLMLNSAVLTMDGNGSVNLADEAVALHLRPQGRVAGTGIVVPLSVTGPIRAPRVSTDAVGTAAANAGTIAGAVIGDATPLGLLGGLLAHGVLSDTGNADACAGALAVARGQAAPASSAPAAAGPAKLPEPGALLRQLFH